MDPSSDGSGDGAAANAPLDLVRLAAEMNVPREALESAVQAVGPDRDRIKDYLTGGAAATQQDG